MFPKVPKTMTGDGSASAFIDQHMHKLYIITISQILKH